MYIYESHMGGVFASDTFLNHEDCYCEQCGDSDYLIGYAYNRKEAWELLKDNTNINDSGGWDYDYIKKFIESNFED